MPETTDDRRPGAIYFEPRGSRFLHEALTVERRHQQLGVTQGDLIRRGLNPSGYDGEAGCPPRDPAEEDIAEVLAELSVALNGIEQLFGPGVASALACGSSGGRRPHEPTPSRLDRIDAATRQLGDFVRSERARADRHMLEAERLTIELTKAQNAYDERGDHLNELGAEALDATLRRTANEATIANLEGQIVRLGKTFGWSKRVTDNRLKRARDAGAHASLARGEDLDRA